MVSVLCLSGDVAGGCADAGRGGDDALYRSGTASADEPSADRDRTELYAGGVFPAYHLRNTYVCVVPVLCERILPDRTVPVHRILYSTPAGCPAENVLLLI